MANALNLSAVHFIFVDDNKYMCSVVKAILIAMGAKHIDTYQDANDAYKDFLAFSADIIIADWLMKPIDGIEFSKNIRTSPESPNPMVPVIMMSAFSQRDRVTQARDAGVTEFLIKPISPKALYLRIEEVILRPRQFIRTTAYFGPNRRRHEDENHLGPYRRKTDTDPSVENMTENGASKRSARMGKRI
jgi:two-component system, chemotaxis family, chemotaxis protein CheY